MNSYYKTQEYIKGKSPLCIFRDKKLNIIRLNGLP